MNTLECIKTINYCGANYIKGKQYIVKNESEYSYEVESEEKYIIVYSKFKTNPYYYGNIFKAIKQ